MEKPTTLEKISGSPVAQGMLTAISAWAGTPLAALLPVLSDTLAAGRHQARVDKALTDIETTLKKHGDQLNKLTDAQYKLTNEIVLAVLQNTENEKIDYLNRAILGSIEHTEINHTIAAQVARALRDMTAGELAFVIENFDNVIMIGPVSGDVGGNVRLVDRNANEMVYVSGLMGLGILNPAGSTMDDGGKYVFAKFCGTLKELVT